ncbi:uncharacterized protein BDR25DRAFT_343720 [Lindgomyces ingoldianus]|uniref:Uncharacterized protein n=1 Tax=Lindgomyces ingoldianus TaxID=673940 RepID=A0ACB6QQX2_9PLEO|nr:uncharacterized protein BDR25DRAFT_343720 [Lindgomyces ingoldianus]KAF2469321.1 hypothetical protein BDR25DRAFT_343720 [Lindgomyces ingoldianus]
MARHKQNHRKTRESKNRTAGISSNNLYMNLAEDTETGEVNAHLAERFAGFCSPYDNKSQPRAAPASAFSRANIQEYFKLSQEPVAGGTWVQKPEFPSASEILPTPNIGTRETIIDVSEDLRHNKVEGAYDTHEEYLSTQYSLLREDAIRPLREAVSEVQASPWLDESQYPKGANIGIYDPVYITSIVFSPRGLATRVAFSLSRVKKLVRWEQSKRLIPGTLVALSPADDCFQTQCILATVAARALAALDQNPPEIDLFFANPADMEIDPMKKWVMVESRSTFYEASRHTLMALQHMMQEPQPFPLSEHLVQAQSQVDAPIYVQQNPFKDMSSLVALEENNIFENVDILKEWPSSSSHGLDKSQSNALKRILTKRLAIVQGPPGTGKTYISVVALKILLANMRKEDPPIIVTCQTNHALDQLLRHAAEFEPNFVRLGGRSKDTDKVKRRTLFEVRSNFSQPKNHTGLKSIAMKMIRELTKRMQMLLAPLESNKPPLDHRLLEKLGLITNEQAESLEMEPEMAMGISPNTPGIQMEQWLGRSLTPCLRPIAPDDFGFEFEEEDFELEQLKELEAEAVARDDDDIEALKGPYILLSDNKTGRGAALMDQEIRQLLRRAQDLTTIPTAQRGAVYNYFQRETKRLLRAEFRELAKAYENAVLDRRVGQWEIDYRILKDQRVIGMTTTGLSKYRGLVASLSPKIVLVEEAAETLEAPITAACVPSLEHLILVGDHQQLRPHCSVREFENEPYHFNLSLFERMVNNDVEYETLKRQRRMIPEIRRLLRPIYGEELKDHPSVKLSDNRPPVEGMGGNNSFFFHHQWPESRDGNMSSTNDMEANMIVGFVDYLIFNNVSPIKITILTFYNGQRKTILKKLRKHQNLKDLSQFNVVTVDSYQGEENDIVLLSLVRSNKRHNIGFLSVDNRVCVALSRAKRGFYIFGNAEMLACESGAWADVVDIMCGKKFKKDKPTTGQELRVGFRFPLQCTQHGNKTWIKEPDDWDIVNGGCDQPCRCLLPCGHTCMLKCHPFDKSRVNCTQKCMRRVELCGHPCAELCCDPCKCQFCGRRDNGMRATLKPTPRNSAYNAPAPPSSFVQHSRNAFAGTFYGGSSFGGGACRAALEFQSPSQAESTHRSSGSSVEQWKAYAKDGAKEDDAQALRNAKEMDTKFFEQIARTPSAGQVSLVTNTKVSPVKPRISLLVDLEENVQSNQHYKFKDTLFYTAAAATTIAAPVATSKRADGLNSQSSVSLLD